MPRVREIMSTDVAFVSRQETARDAAGKMAELDVGMLPICNEERRIDGAITDRDIAVKVVAAGRDPATTTVGELADRTEVVTIGADDDVRAALDTMKEHAVRRLPVIDGHEVVGMISQADVARSLPEQATGDVVQAISDAPPNS
jgi:CBS domain-containing protein